MEPPMRWSPPMRTKRAALLASISSVFVLLAGCVHPPTDRATNTPGGPTQRETTSGASLEGRFGYATMDAYVVAVVPLIRQWLDETWPQMPPPRVVFVPDGTTGPEACVAGGRRPATYTSSSYEYCGPEQTVYVGQDTLWTFYSRAGDAGPAVGLAHEFGHHIQRYAEVPNPRSLAQSVRFENQADCIAGAWIRYTSEQGWLEYEDDLADVDALFPLIGSAEGPGRDHGTTEERAHSFQFGFDGGLPACGLNPPR